MKNLLLACVVFAATFSNLTAQQSVAREWNEELLSAIRLDFARPTVHARNLFHSSVAMYDAWALFDSQAETVFLGKNYKGYDFVFNGIATPGNIDAARAEMMSYTMFRLLSHRFANAPNAGAILTAISTHFTNLGYDPNFTSIDYSTDSYAALGNYFAAEIINFGMQDGSNEQNNYANQYYTATNAPLILQLYEDNTTIDPNKWQPLAFDVFVDQSGNTFPSNTPDFLSPEWGEVIPFSLKNEDLAIINNGFDCYVYNDPGPPAYIQNSNEDGIDDPYKWYFALVIAWSSHLDPDDSTMIDISPASLGNVDIANFPETFQEYQAFYDFTNGGDPGTGYASNPKTGLPYTPQLIKRGDYARVLAEFWADGPDSETPPGHWFTILNYVSDHPDTVKQFNGQGTVLSDLEWDVKSYLALGGAMHDSAVDTWGIKGYYDFIRPVSAIRYMAGKGQSTNTSLASYDPHGLPLITGLIELINTGDPLAGSGDENVGKIKVKSWKGPDFITNPDTDVAGVDWILGEHWWPYQRPTFVTPPFAGYLSGHSTFSRAAAEVLTLLTGDAFFPGGMGTFDVIQNDFLVFEEGPTESFTLQWATYRDASDQTSLSRIWGGIHPPIDDIRGRQIGEQIGVDAFNLAVNYFNATLSVPENTLNVLSFDLFPNPVVDNLNFQTENSSITSIEIYSLNGVKLLSQEISNNNSINLSFLQSGLYFVSLLNQNDNILTTKKIVKQ
ncbi:T9SS type A sorting domain-containing protein [Lacinutrix sp. Hel_I_90]|uniref:T9SS type A sorting domain-containing protein n=1 Tax=Lacinutrix sp. Hel_I_90 TaxID=1249999 RepID=UPI0005CB4266|nr:T9SS type A sorting domain-containing protein [Lacinutrix sp. Hel_I_90]